MPYISRAARLDDAAAICDLFRARIPAWQRLDSSGRVHDVPYESLSLYERWMHGGAWMSLETGAIFLNHLLLGAGYPIVAVDEAGDRVTGYMEAYLSSEGEPFGTQLNIAHLIAADDATAKTLLAAAAEYAAALKASHVTAASPGDVELPQGTPATVLDRLNRYSLSAREGQVFYKVTHLTNTGSAQINGWSMPLGRVTSARHQWELVMPPLFETIPEIADRRHTRMRLSASGQDAIVYAQARLHDPRSVDIAVWTPKGLQPQIVTALCDWARREGYRTLWMLANETALKALGGDAESDGFVVQIQKLDLSH